jgi:predicted nuclease of predicted toxin-antitoxin system
LFLTDENIPFKIVDLLRSLNYEVFDLRENQLCSLSDEEILKLAKDKNLVLITFDKHFSNIAKYPPEQYSGTIRIRIHPPILEDINNALKLLLERMKIEEMRGRLIVLEKNGYRIRKSTETPGTN